MIIRSPSSPAGDSLAQRNALYLAVASGLAGANAAVVFATGSIVGQSLASDVAWATLPASTFVFGTMLATYPVAFAAKRFGRKATFMGGNIVGAWAGVLAAIGITLSSFTLFCIATCLAGAYQAVVQSYRYAAADTATPAFRPKAISWVLTGGVAAAFIGPQLVIWTKDLLPPYLFVASFIGQAVFALATIAVTRKFVDQSREEVLSGSQRPFAVIARQPRFIVAVLCGTMAQALMNFVMTAAPLAMVQCGHSVVDSTLGIQWHIIAMFAPSFFTGTLIQRFGKERMVIAGMVILAACGVVNLMGLTLGHFWVALVLLGIGWNFAFIGATAMITDCHSPAERAKVQGFNDFVIFSITTIGSLLAGYLLAKVGWNTINGVLMPVAGLCIAALIGLKALQRHNSAQTN
ncbi:MAG: MFS transporter [Beijerinckiaceae bacterium]